MLPAPLTRQPRGIAWIALSFALVMAWALTVPAQSEPQDKPSPKGGQAGSKAPSSGKAKDKGQDEDEGQDEETDKKADGGKAKEGEDAAAKPAKTELEERFVDERITDEMISKDYKTLFPNEKSWSRADQERLNPMAAGDSAIDNTLLKHFVHAAAADLTNKRYVNALRNDDGNPADVENFEQAARRLIKAYDTANERKNSPFRDRLTDELIDKTVGPELLKNNIYARNQYMIALSRSRTPKALETFVSQLNDRDQILSVKLMAAVGTTNLAQEHELDSQQAIRAAKALSGFLDNEKDAFWPIQFRALQALGWLRLTTERGSAGKAEFAETALTLLADPEAHLMVRSWAAWALGMMTPPSSMKYNFLLIATQTGYLAAQIGDRVIEIYPKVTTRKDEHPEPARKLINELLLVRQAFRADPQVGPPKGGILNMNNPSLTSQQVPIREIEKRIREVATAAIALDQAVSRSREARRLELYVRVQELLTYLDNNKPGDLALVPGGNPFPLPEVTLVKRPEPEPAKKKADGRQAKAGGAGRPR
jgi:hypothetical protein